MTSRRRRPTKPQRAESPAGRVGVQRNIEAFLRALAASGGKPFEQMTPAEARAALAALQSSTRVDLPDADVARRTITSDGQTVKLVTVRPVGLTGALPAFMFFPGGGWVLGDFATHERLVRELVAGSGAAAVFVEYDRSPEARYPIAINQAYAATSWVAAHGREIGVDGRRLAVAGNCAGGNMAAVVALMAKDRGRPDLRCQVLMWPVTNAAFDTASYHQFADNHFLTRRMMKWFWDSYTTDPRQREDVYASPLQAANERLKGLAPALIQTAEMDVLRDEGEAYARKLDHAGVDVISTRYNGLIHECSLLNATSHVPGARSAMLQASAELRKRLH
jgi:acetyl esterase